MSEQAASPALIEFAHVSKTFTVSGAPPVRAVDDVSFTIHAGETVGLIGESGSGKSTTGRLVLGLETPDAGVIRYQGTDVATMPPAERRRMRSEVQVVFQEPYESLNPRMRIADIVAEPLVVRGVRDRDERRERVLATLERVGLSSALMRRFPGELSGGQQQRVGIARAIVSRPRVLVLDEPTASLDRAIRAQVGQVLTDLQDELDLGYLLITHDMGTVRRVADNALVMLSGRIVEAGPVSRVMTAPADDYSRLLIGSELPPVPPEPTDPQVTP
jgi:ABC-type glutathione transport system ATPase component